MMSIGLFRETEAGMARWLTRTAQVIAVCALLLVVSTGPAQAEGRQYLHNTVPAAVARAAKVRPSLRLEKLNLAIGLPLRNRETLTNLLQRIYDPASPGYHHYLTPEQFTENFGPTKEDYEAVVHFAQSHGLTVITRHSNRLVVGVKGTVLAVEKAFHVSLDEYQLPGEARTFRAPNTEPSLDLATPVLSIAGLDNYVIPHSCLRPAPTNTAQVNPNSKATPTAGSGPSGAYFSKDFRAAYAPGVTQTGTGQCVGLLEFASGFYQSDITAYETATGEPNIPVYPVLLDSYNGGPGQGNDEVSLDIEMAIGMAPGLTAIYVYEGETTDDILSSMASGPCKQLSASWTYPIDATSDNFFLEFAAQGQSFFNASGDSDAYVGAPATPTDDPNITIVGGTTLTTSGPVGSWTGETVWNDNPSPAGQGTGGGISTDVPIPIWQQGISMAANQGSTVWRNLPDVAMCANNVEVYYDGGTTGAFVGTSCATPLWAAYIALVNQMALANSQPLVGFINPAIYNMGKGSNALPYSSLFHDITSGNNEDSASPTQYVAAAGYDLCTGWGSPAGVNLATALALPEALHITPFSNAIFNGPLGGPFTPASQTYTLTNHGTATLNWALPTPPSWLDVSTTSGTLTRGGASTAVVVSIDPSAADLALGSYSTDLSFTNLTDNFVQSITVTLAVVTVPAITSQPTNQNLPDGATANFNVGIAPDALVYYQWQKNGTNLTDTGNIFGSATATLSVGNISSTDVASYSVIVSNAAGMTNSSSGNLTILSSAPIIVSQPVNFTVLPGANATFSVGVNGNTPYTYRWMFDGTNLANNTKYGGTTNATLTITNCVTTDAGTYSVLVTNSLGPLTSAGAVLTVTPVTAPGIGLNVNAAYTGGTSVANPYSGLVYVSSKTAYFGTCFDGGTDGGGCTYKVNTAGTVSRGYSFTGSTDGAFPVGSLCLGNDGSLYGTSFQFGTYGDGVLFKVTTGGSLTPLVQFNGDNGAEPLAGLMQASDTNLYGSANAGGDYGLGTIFRATTAGALTTVTSFNGFDGAYPSPVLVQGTDGNLYGTAENGGAYESGAGTVFRISLAGNFTLLHSFNGTNDGAFPIAGLIQGVDGNFYGTTLQGGASNQGTVFAIQPSGALATLYSFTGGADGAEPWAGLIQAKDGNLYGTTQQGGTYGGGTVFRIAPTGSLTTIVQFDGYQGSTSEANLVQGPDGNLYGTTFGGGFYGNGAFFSVILTNPGPLSITGQPAGLSLDTGAKATFAVATAGGPPLTYQWRKNGTNLTNGGGLAGVTSAVLTITNLVAANAASYDVIVTSAANSVTSAPAALTILLSQPVITNQPASQTSYIGATAMFTISATGDQPLSYRWQKNSVNLTDGGTLSGSTTATLMITNVVVTNSGTYSVIVSNTVSGVTSSNAVLTVTPPNVAWATSTNLHLFTGGSDGESPSSALIQGNDGNLYGTAESGGSSFQGTIFRSTLAGAVSTLFTFTGVSNGAYPEGGLIQTLNSNLYGTTSGGGANSDGTLFRMTNFATMTFLHAFAGTLDGSEPACSLAQGSDGNFYGTSFAGGTENSGAVYKMTPAGVFTGLYAFTGGADGANPYAGLVQGNHGNFYGTTAAGGSNGDGTVFSITTNGALTTLATFNYTNGAVPFGRIIQATDGNYYGTTSLGGANGDGTVFRYSASGGLTTLHTFAGTDGAFPAAGLIQGPGGFLYGTTETGGIYNQGSVFLLSTNGVFTTLLWLDGFNGAEPESSLALANDGNLYGTTAFGGTGWNPSSGGGNGTIFKITLPVLVEGPLSATNAVARLPYSASLIGEAAPPVGDSFSYSLVSGPAWLNVAANGLLSGAPTDSNIGANTFVIGVTDSIGFFASTNLQIIVIADPPPSFLANPFAETAANAGQAYSGDISTNATAPYINAGDILSFAAVSGPAWLNLAPDGTLSGTPYSVNAGTNTFVVSVTDLGGLTVTGTMNIDVMAVPVTVSITNLGTNVLLQWSGGVAPYQLQVTTNLAPVNWQNVGGPTSATSLILSPSNNPSYFRIQGE